LHSVSLWAAEYGLTLAQVACDKHSNEITAIPELLSVLDLKGCLVTIDAMGCQKEIAKKIVEKEADFILAVKRNQEGLYEEVFNLFQKAHDMNFQGLEWDAFEKEEKSHGRHEIRRYWTISSLDALKKVQEWTHVRTIGMVESECTCKGETSREYRFYISSMTDGAERFAHAVRSHWGIENSLHWVLDVAFREDESRIRIGHAAENFSIVRRIALNLIKQEQSLKIGIKAKRLRAGWDEKYFLKILST